MASFAVVGMTITVWMFLSMGIIFMNASILKSYQHPIALTCWHMVVSCMLVSVLQLVKPGLLSTGDEANGIPPLTCRRSIELGVPVAVMAATGLVCSNTAYLYLSVSFIQMIKAWTCACVYVSGCLMGTQKWSIPIAKTLGVITVGLMIASFGELNFNAYGFMMQVISLLSEAMRINMLEIRLKSQGYKLTPLSSMKVFAPLIMVLLGCLLFLLDPAALDVNEISTIGWSMFAANGLMACALNIFVFAVIQVASGLVFTLGGIVKDFMIIFGSALFRGEQTTLLQVLGYSMAVGGLQAYTAVSKAPAEFEAGVLSELIRRFCAWVKGKSPDGNEGVSNTDKSTAADEAHAEPAPRHPERGAQELRGIIGATTDLEDHDAEEEMKNSAMKAFSDEPLDNKDTTKPTFRNTSPSDLLDDDDGP